jgi:hypothetical protein
VSATVPPPGPATRKALNRDTAVAAYAAARGITEVLHFTTAPPGMVGICVTGAVLSRDRLDRDKYIEHIYKPNTRDRLKDAEWTDYVNLSISRVNKRMLDSSENWHAADGIWWAVLSFDPVILTHPGVHFTTTNNTYTATVRRATGRDGLADMFSDKVPWGHYGAVDSRREDTPRHWTTNEQAEVLYPGELPLTYLRAVYVADPEHIDDANTWIRGFSTVPTVSVNHRAEIFA